MEEDGNNDIHAHDNISKEADGEFEEGEDNPHCYYTQILSMQMCGYYFTQQKIELFTYLVFGSLLRLGRKKGQTRFISYFKQRVL